MAILRAMGAMRPQDWDLLRRVIAWKHRPKVYLQGDATTPSPQQIYTDLMKTAFGPALRGAGLRGSGGRFELPSEVYWAQLGFQKSAYSDGQEVRFTVNLSVIRRDEWTDQVANKQYLGKRPSPTFHYGPWAAQTRIGDLTPHGRQWGRRQPPDTPY